MDNSYWLKIIWDLGIKTNYDMLYAAYKKAKDNADFIVIQTGDTYRLNKYMSVSDETIKELNKIYWRSGRVFRQDNSEIDTDTLYAGITFPSLMIFLR